MIEDAPHLGRRRKPTNFARDCDIAQEMQKWQLKPWMVKAVHGKTGLTNNFTIHYKAGRLHAVSNIDKMPKHYMTKKGLGIWTRESMSVPLLMKPMIFREGPRTTLASTKIKCRRSSSDDENEHSEYY